MSRRRADLHDWVPARRSRSDRRAEVRTWRCPDCGSSVTVRAADGGAYPTRQREELAGVEADCRLAAVRAVLES